MIAGAVLTGISASFHFLYKMKSIYKYLSILYNTSIMVNIQLERAQARFEEVVEEDEDILARDYEQLIASADELDLPLVQNKLRLLDSTSTIERGYFRTRHGYDTSPRLGLVLAQELYLDMNGIEPSQRITEFSKKLLEYAGLDEPDINFRGVGGNGSDEACIAAELYFTDALQQVGERRYISQSRVTMYHDQNGAPVLLRKSEDVSSALTLCGIEISGVPIVPGTIVGVDKRASKEKTGSLQFEYQGFEIATHLLQPDLLVNPIRISPWAYPNPLDRALFAMSSYGAQSAKVDRDRQERVVPYSLEDFHRCAHVISELCSVASSIMQPQSIEDTQSVVV